MLINSLTSVPGWFEWGFQKRNIRHLRTRGMSQVKHLNKTSMKVRKFVVFVSSKPTKPMHIILYFSSEFSNCHKYLITSLGDPALPGMIQMRF